MSQISADTERKTNEAIKHIQRSIECSNDFKAVIAFAKTKIEQFRKYVSFVAYNNVDGLKTSLDVAIQNYVETYDMFMRLADLVSNTCHVFDDKFSILTAKWDNARYQQSSSCADQPLHARMELLLPGDEQERSINLTNNSDISRNIANIIKYTIKKGKVTFSVYDKKIKCHPGKDHSSKKVLIHLKAQPKDVIVEECEEEESQKEENAETILSDAETEMGESFVHTVEVHQQSFTEEENKEQVKARKEFFSFFTQEAEVQEAHVQEVEIQEAEIQEDEIQEAEIQEAEIQEAEIQEVEIEEVHIKEIKILKTKIQEAEIQEAEKEKTKREVEKIEAEKEKARKEQAEQEKAVKEEAEREKAEKEQAEKEEVEKEKAANLQAENEKVAKEEVEREKAKREQAEKEKAAKLQAEKEKAVKEEAEREKAKKEQAEKEKAAKLQAEKENAKREQAEKEKAANEKAEEEKAKKEQAEKEKANKEQAEKEKAKKEEDLKEAAKKEKAKQTEAEKEITKISITDKGTNVGIQLEVAGVSSGELDECAKEEVNAEFSTTSGTKSDEKELKSEASGTKSEEKKTVYGGRGKKNKGYYKSRGKN